MHVCTSYVPQEKSQARVDVLKDTTNQKYYRVVTVRGVPTSVTHAVQLLCEVKRKHLLVHHHDQCDVSVFLSSQGLASHAARPDPFVGVDNFGPEKSLGLPIMPSAVDRPNCNGVRARSSCYSKSQFCFLFFFAANVLEGSRWPRWPLSKGRRRRSASKYIYRCMAKAHDKGAWQMCMANGAPVKASTTAWKQ